MAHNKHLPRKDTSARVCSFCNAAGDEQPTHCPNRFMTPGERAAVKDGMLDFKAGKWCNLTRLADAKEHYLS